MVWSKSRVYHFIASPGSADVNFERYTAVEQFERYNTKEPVLLVEQQIPRPLTYRLGKGHHGTSQQTIKLAIG
jgi:hypothetical protein